MILASKLNQWQENDVQNSFFFEDQISFITFNLPLDPMRSPKDALNCRLSKRGYGTSPKAVKIARPRKSVNLAILMSLPYMYQRTNLMICILVK